MGLVIFTGISIGTLFTLFLVPAWYVLMERIGRWLHRTLRGEESDHALQGAE